MYIYTIYMKLLWIMVASRHRTGGNGHGSVLRHRMALLQLPLRCSIRAPESQKPCIGR
jgi:hypothetical protein